MGLGARFGNRVGVKTADSGVVNEAAVAAAKPVASKPAPAATAPAPAKSGGLGARFGKGGSVSAKPSTTEAPAGTSKIDTKVTTNGMSSGGSTPVVGGTLKDRLRALVKPGSANAAAVEKAATSAPTNTVGAPAAKLAVGINPPDAATEWNQEQQAAEGEKLVSAGKSKAEKKAEKALVSAADMEAVQKLEEQVTASIGEGLKEAAEALEAPKRGPGRPKGSVKKSEPAITPTVEMRATAPAVKIDTTYVANGYSDIELLDDIAQRWLSEGNRRGALLLLQAAETAASAA